MAYKDKTILIDRDQVFKIYMDYVNMVSSDLEDKTVFEPKEIVNKICDIIETIIYLEYLKKAQEEIKKSK
jgi:hypothetical protein